MAKERKYHPDFTTGFGDKSSDAGGRFYRRDGSVNVVKKGVRFLDRFSWFHTWLSMRRWKFWFSLCMSYVVINFIFASVYYMIGTQYLNGIEPGTTTENFGHAFFFSAQTFTTVGYGHISPQGFWTSAIASFEAFLGMIGFALAAGIFYGRFSMPRPYIYFSRKALISPFKDGKALMFRLVPYKNTSLTDVEVKLTLAMRIEEEQGERNEFFPLHAEINKINVLVLNWTIVHAITDDSPLHGFTLEQLKEMRAELLVFISGYDEVFANMVIARTSYVVSEIVDGAKFRPMYQPSPEGNSTILHVNRLNDYDRVNA